VPEQLLTDVPEPTSVGSGVARTAVNVPVVQEYGELVVPAGILLRDGTFDFFADAVKRQMFEVRLRGKDVVLKAGHFIGRIAINERFDIEVVARVPATSLGRILRISGHLPIESERLMQEYATSEDPHPPVLDIFVRALLRALRPVETEGVYRRYERTVETSSFPRGRFLLTETVARQYARGHRSRATTSVFEHMKDNGPNRLLKLALWHAAALVAGRAPRRGGQRMLSDLNEAFALFDGVALDLGLGCLDDAETLDPTRLPSTRDYYAPAIRLARVILEGRSIEYDRIGNEVLLPSLLIDLQGAFEDYLLAVLRRRLLPIHRGLEIVTGNVLEPVGGGKRLFDTGSDVPAQPDLVFRIGWGDGRFHLVGEVKYIDRPFSRDHINQAISYAVSYRVPAVLIRPRMKDEAQGLSLIGVVDKTSAYSYLYDIGGDLVREEEEFARAMASLLSLAPESSAA
jgi:5-methylcytosine-specific restriction enzyme subunit McrC